MSETLAAACILLAVFAGLTALFLADIAGENDAPGYWRGAVLALGLALALAGAAGWALSPAAPLAAIVTGAR